MAPRQQRLAALGGSLCVLCEPSLPLSGGCERGREISKNLLEVTCLQQAAKFPRPQGSTARGWNRASLAAKEGPAPEDIGTLVSQSCSSKVPHAGQLATVGSYSLLMTEAKGPKSR